MPAIQTIYTGNKKTDEYLSNIYKILNQMKASIDKAALKTDLINTNKVLNSITDNGIYVDLTEANEKRQLKRNGPSGTVFIITVEDPAET